MTGGTTSVGHAGASIRIYALMNVMLLFTGYHNVHLARRGSSRWGALAEHPSQRCCGVLAIATYSHDSLCPDLALEPC